jgi:outer membrane protein, multidrug efflux system
LPAFLPAELLERRPDVRAAEAQLMAATAGIGVSRAERLPRVNLSGASGDAAAASTGDLFTGFRRDLETGAAVAGPLWDFGRSAARVESATALAEQAEVRYRLTVQGAFNDVRNALVFYETSQDRTESSRRLVESLERTERLAELRYQEGFISFLEYLDAQRALLSARLALEEAVRDHLVAAASLFKALGGGWQG